jgi:hypothetical protein
MLDKSAPPPTMSVGASLPLTDNEPCPPSSGDGVTLDQLDWLETRVPFYRIVKD